MKEHFTLLFRNIFLSIICLLVLNLSIHEVNGQDIQYSQFYAAPLYINPAFAGGKHNTRAALHQRWQWPSLGSQSNPSTAQIGVPGQSNLASYTTSMLSFDAYSAKYQSGFGATFIYDRQGGNTISSTEVQLMYAYEFHLNSKWTARGGVQLGHLYRYPEYRFIYGSQLDDVRGYIGGSDPLLAYGKESINMWDVSAGGLIYSDNLWVSFSSHHINTPQQSYINSNNTLPVKYGIATGYKINVHGKDDGLHHDQKTDISFTPTLNYKFQGNNDQVDLGLYGIYNAAMLGFWYRGIPFKQYKTEIQNNESLVILGGFHYQGFTFGYSYDFTVSTLSQRNTGGSHELNLTYVFDKHKTYGKPKLMKRLPCPDFYHHFNSNDQSHLK